MSNQWHTQTRCIFVLLLYLSCTTPNLGIFSDDVSIKAQIHGRVLSCNDMYSTLEVRCALIKPTNREINIDVMSK